VIVNSYYYLLPSFFLCHHAMDRGKWTEGEEKKKGREEDKHDHSNLLTVSSVSFPNHHSVLEDADPKEEEGGRPREKKKKRKKRGGTRRFRRSIYPLFRP